MEIELNQEERQLIDNLVAQGRFSSATEVVSASLTLMQAPDEWKEYAQERIDAGMEAAQRDDFASEAEVDALFSRYQRKSA